MRTDAAPDIRDRLRSAIERHARRSLASRPGAPITVVFRESLLSVFAEKIRLAGPDRRLRAAEAYSALVGLCPRASARDQFHLSIDDRSARKSAGAYYTPGPLVDLILQATLDPLLDHAAAAGAAAAQERAILALRVHDPACGVGHFLVPAARRLAERLAAVRSRAPAAAAIRAALHRVVAHCIFGRDIDPAAAAICRMVLRAEAGLGPGPDTLDDHITHADSLIAAPPAGAPFHAVIGNPPFVNAIEGGTGARTRAALRRRFPELGPLADLSHYFLALATRLVAPGGRVGLVLPRAILGSDAAGGVRSGLPSHLRPTLLYAPREATLFHGADVHVCVAALGSERTCRVGLGGRRWRRTEITDGNWWRAMQQAGRAAAPPGRAGPRLGDTFEVRSNMFINDAYVLRTYLADDEHGDGPRLVTTGLIEPRECLWGRAGCRYLGRDYRFPRVVPAANLPASLARRVAAARRPKVLIAGLARRIECFVDADGECIGSVGTYAVFDPGDDVDRLRAVCDALLTPAATTLFRDTLGANALSGGNTGLRIAFLRGLPLPPAVRPAGMRRVRPVQ